MKSEDGVKRDAAAKSDEGVKPEPPASAAPSAAASDAPAAAAPAAAADGAAPAARASGTKERRPCSASVCVLRFRSGGEASEASSIDLTSCLRFAACGRANGTITLSRISRERLLESRFSASTPEPAPQPTSALSLVGHTGPVYSCAFSRDSRFVLSAGQDGGVRLWAARHAQCLVAYRGHAHPVFHAAFSPHNAHFITSCYDGALRLYTTERRAPLRVLAGHTSDINHGSFHPNGAYALSVCLSPAQAPPMGAPPLHGTHMLSAPRIVAARHPHALCVSLLHGTHMLSAFRCSGVG